tara:strand:+ start:187 stop:453 length:267 start_codon:yes stop_codon:yes gene_type:complete
LLKCTPEHWVEWADSFECADILNLIEIRVKQAEEELGFMDNTHERDCHLKGIRAALIDLSDLPSLMTESARMQQDEQKTVEDTIALVS